MCYNINDLIEIMKKLRAPDGCPWDREQTHKSIRNNFIEETYEAIEAIDTDNCELLREELGDVLLQVIFHSEMESEVGNFTFDDVVNDICKKLIIRHPHVFGDLSVENSSEVLKNWEMIKNKTKGMEKCSDTLVGVSNALPSLMRAQKVGARAAKVNFDFQNVSQALTSLENEISELKDAINNNDNVEEEVGDVLFSCVNVSRKLNISSEEALTKATEKFISRFKLMEQLISNDQKNLSLLSLEQLDEYWDKVKKM